MERMKEFLDRCSGERARKVSWSSIKSEILVLLKNRKQLLFDQYLANAILHDKTDIRRCRCPDQTGRVRFLGTF